MIRYLRAKLASLKAVYDRFARLARLGTSVDYNRSAIVELQGRLDYGTQALAELQVRLDAAENALSQTPRAMAQLQLRHEAELRQLRVDWRTTLYTQQQALLGAARALAVTPMARADGAGVAAVPFAGGADADPGRTHPCRILVPEALDAQARTGQSTWLDLGCGGGSWLQELVSAGIGAHGIDHRELAVAAAQARGLTAQLGNERYAVEAEAPGSLVGISAFDLIERLATGELPGLIEAAWQALAPGGVLMLSGANPENLAVALFGLWQAPERVRLWLPDTVSGYTRARGYTHQRLLRWRLAPDGTTRIDEDGAVPACLQARADTDPARILEQACHAPDRWVIISRKPA